MKMRVALCLSSCLVLTLTGCGKAEKLNMQSQISDLRSNNVALQGRLTELSSSNLILQGKLLEVHEKVKSGEELNALLRQQLDSATAQINRALETAKANAEREKQKPIEESIRALRRFDSAVTVSITFDEYRKRLQDLKVAVDENNQRIKDAKIRQLLLSAYTDYEDAYVVWAVSLDQGVGDWKAVLKSHGLWTTNISDFEKKYGTEEFLTRVTKGDFDLYNYQRLKYAVSPCLRACFKNANFRFNVIVPGRRFL